MYDFVMPFIIQMVSEMKSRDNEIKKEQNKEKEKKVTTTTLDFVSHDLEMMMPGSNLMITGGPQNYSSVGGGMPPGGVPPMGPQGSGFGGNMMGSSYPNPNSPYPPRPM